MPASDIVVKGAREHNLRDVDLVLPRNKLVCLTGVSGSGKSSLAFDTLYAEGQRRYVESLSTFARQFLGQMPKPEVDHISGLSPSISISQKSSGQNPRSTVGTVTEIYDYLRVLYARTGQGHCPKCRRPITAQSREQIIQRIMTLPDETQFLILAPLIRAQKGEHRDLFVDLLKQGFSRARVDGRVVQLTEDLRLDRQMRHHIEVVVDRLVASSAASGGIRPRLAEAVELALRLGEGNLIVATRETASDGDAASEAAAAVGNGIRAVPGAIDEDTPAKNRKRSSRERRASDEIVLSAHYACTHCGLSFESPSPQLFSFNSPQGMCTQCDGLGEIYGFDVARMVPNPKLTFKEGCFELVGLWKEMGRWRRHIYQGVADTIERLRGLPRGTLLETQWDKLPAELQNVWLWGTGEQHITFTWRSGAHGQKYGGQFEGILPQLLSRYRTSKSRIQRRQLEKYMSVVPCGACGGARLNPQARSVTLTSAQPKFADRPERSLPEVCGLSVADAAEFFGALKLDPIGQTIAAELVKEIRGRLGFLVNVGLEYLTLDRTAPTLSGGESQRIRLAGQIGCGLVGVLYILDEPSIGLHPRDNQKLLDKLTQLRDKGNTVLVVEHDEDTMRAADTIVDFGPGPGVRGGHLVAQGTAAAVARSPRSITGKYLSGKVKIEVPTRRRALRSENGAEWEVANWAQRQAESRFRRRARLPSNNEKTSESGPDADSSPAATDPHPSSFISAFSTPTLRVLGARHNNLRAIDVEIPLGAFVCVTGVSGSGKSSLVSDILVEALRRDLNGGVGSPGGFERIEGIEHLDKLIAIDQSPIGRTTRSNQATYIKVFDDIRDLYARLPESKTRGYKPGRFSFNVGGGRCEACEGNGSNRLEMDFLADVWVTCPVCEGHRFSRETLQVRFKGKNIAEVLEMDIQQALEHFENIPDVRHKLQTLHDVGLDYLKLGQPSPTLSGGEAQRIKLARELAKKSTGRTLYLLDEPTTGLHFADIQMLLKVLHDFVDAGNTVLVVEHNLDVVKTADWLIDLGPEGGAGGGLIIGAGTPEALAANADSHTGQALAAYLDPALQRRVRQENAAARAARKKASGDGGLVRGIRVRGASQHNLKGIDVDIPRDKMTVCCGLSGSGKSSLAMDTIYAEGQRRYVESLSSYARQFVGQMQKPKLDYIDGLSPAIAIEQKHMGHTPRSTVGTVTEIYDYLRVLMARLGQPFCPACDIPIGTQSADEIIDKLMAEPTGTRLYLMAPLEIQVGQQYETLWEEIRAGGYPRMRVDGKTYNVDQPPTIDRRRKHLIEVVIDRVTVRADARSRIAGSVETALAMARGVLHVAYVSDEISEPRWRTEVHSQHFACDRCGRSFERLTPHNFSFNSPLGWCPTCEGLGIQTGANPAALVHDPKLSLAEGAIRLWPDVAAAKTDAPGKPPPVFAAMLAALSAHTGVQIDVPFEQLTARQRRVVLYGCGEEWIDVPNPIAADASDRRGGKKKEAVANAAANAATKNALPWFRFQYKGLYPALEEAARLSPAMRGKLDPLIDEVECSTCDGTRLRDDAASMRLKNLTIGQIGRLPLERLVEELARWQWTSEEKKVAGELIREIQTRVQFLVDVGLEYLTLARPAPTLSGGEAQRIRLASQVGSGLCGVLYVLDEPTIGLHPRDNRRLLTALEKLRDLGNTLLVVEHDREVVRAADQLLDFGPGAGEFGGQIVARGTPAQVAKINGSVTGPYLSGKKAIAVPTNRRMAPADPVPGNARNRKRTSPRGSVSNSAGGFAGRDLTSAAEPPGGGWLEIVGARHNNLRNITARIPLGTLTAVTGVSGSGKSSLIEDVLYKSLAHTLHRARVIPAAHDEIRGLRWINKVIRVDQQPLGNSPTSNPATYTGVFDLIRTLFAQLPDAKIRGYQPRRFSFNAPGGRCEACEGNGQKRIEMHFLPDVWVECDVCRGRRYNPETLAVRFHNQSIADVLDMPCGRAVRLFEEIPKIRRILQTLCDVGLDYLTLGQPAPTLSGGEAQRVKLAAELARPDTGQTLFLLDEPTTGLHFDDLAKLLDVLNRLVDLGNTVVVIEHNLDVIKTADWIIDMGPEAGEGGGYLVAAGTPEQIARGQGTGVRGQGAAATGQGAGDRMRSYTGEALAPMLEAGPHLARVPHDFAVATTQRPGDIDITDVGRTAKMPWEADGRRWHTQECISRNGQRCRWDGQILARVVDRIHELGQFSPTDWNNRSVVEISALKKSDGWFFHAITLEQWLLKLKFRVARNTFQRDDLVNRLWLKPLNEIAELPVYGNGPRVQCKSLRGPWQEVQLHVHALDEIDRPEFWQFLEQAVAGFNRFTQRVQQRPEDVMPWKVLGQKWHFARKGFPPGKKIQWEIELLEELCEMLAAAAPGGQFLWNNQQIVHLLVRAQSEPWATVHTKRPDAVDLQLTGPKNRFALGQLTELGNTRHLDTTQSGFDRIHVCFHTLADLSNGDLPGLLREHFAAVNATNGQSSTKTMFAKSPPLQKAVS
jgi:excinuclease ABC subunit A